jgi:hypothetical protein
MSASEQPKERTGFHFYYRNIDQIRPSFQEQAFMLIVTLALMVGLPAAIAGIFWGMAQLGATWGGGH